MSIRKREWVTSKGERKEAWIVDYVSQTDRHIRTFKRKKEADAYHASVNVDVASGTHTPPSKSKTVAEAGQLWIKSCEANELERASIDSYRQHLDLHMVPYLGARKLSELTTPLIVQFRDDLLAGKPAPGETEGKKRTPVMAKRILVSLGSMLADAQERGLVAQNVVRTLRANRKRGKDRRAERRQHGKKMGGKLKIGVHIPAPKEIKAFVAHLQGRWRPLLLTAIFTGLRASELRGLRWTDVDDKAKPTPVIHVRQRADKYKKIDIPKSEAGERDIPLTPLVVNTLREWKLRCPKGKLGLVFPTGTGAVEDHGNIVRRGLIPGMIAAGITKPVKDADGKPAVKAKYSGLHALRHFYASWCFNRRADGGLELPAKLVQERLGHSSIVMTMDVYGHLFPPGDDGSELAEAERLLLA